MTSSPRQLPREELDDWLAAAAAELGVDAASVDIGLVLRLTGDVAHGVARPAAPLTAYLLGLAVGRADDPASELEVKAQALSELARNWPRASA
jgi:hypothetical protein